MAAHEGDCIVEVGMEHSSAGREILAIFRRIQPEFPSSRLAMQANMHATYADLIELAQPPRIRLVKGAFDETVDLAIRNGADVTAQYRYLAGWALQNLPDPAFGTQRQQLHRTRPAGGEPTWPAQAGLRVPDVVRRPAAAAGAAVRDGYRVRVYLPYGEQWYPYLTRRMAEKPANLLLVLEVAGGVSAPVWEEDASAAHPTPQTHARRPTCQQDDACLSQANSTPDGAGVRTLDSRASDPGPTTCRT